MHAEILRPVNRFLFMLLLVFLPSLLMAEEIKKQTLVAVDTTNGNLPQQVRSELAARKCVIRELTSPITPNQLAGVSTLILSGPFRTEMTPAIKRDASNALYKPSEIESMARFVVDGGSLIGAGIGWTWIFSDYGNKKITDHPINQLGTVLGFKLCEFNIEGRPSFRRSAMLDGVEESTALDGMAISAIEVKAGKREYLLSSKDNNYCAAGAKRGKGMVYIFGHQGILECYPKIVTNIIFSNISSNPETDTDSARHQTPDNIDSGDEAHPNNTPTSSKTQDDQVDNNAKTSPLADENRPPLVILGDQAPNVVQWLVSPLRTKNPDDLEGNIMLLRERILDEALTLPEDKRNAHMTAARLCETIQAAFEERYKFQVSAQLIVAKRTENAQLHNQQLNARRSSSMSWPQYSREIEQRGVLLEYRKDATESASKEAEEKWSARAVILRQKAATIYKTMRQQMREHLIQGNSPNERHWSH